MNQIEEGNVCHKTQYCVSCLCYNNYRTLHCYKLHCERLMEIFQKDFLWVCFLCKRIIENAEWFIQSVLNNQILLKDVHSISDKSLKNQLHPICNLNVVPLDPIELSGNATDNPECPSIYKYGIYRNCNVKVEFKHEDDIDEEDSGNEFTGDLDFDVDGVKEEQFISSGPVKRELDIEADSDLAKSEIKETILSERCHQSEVVKVQNGCDYSDKFDTFNIETFHITKEQCMEELEQKAKERNYLNALYKCKMCVKVYRFKPSYDKHMELHSKGMGDFECSVCKQRMASESKLASHMRYHETRYRCRECGLVRINKSTILDHYLSRHSSGFEIVCRICHKTFKRPLSLRKHMLCHKTGERVICAYCLKTYKSKDTLRSHILLQHPSEVSTVNMKKRWICKQCGQGFKAPSQLKLHSAKHSLERNYYCVECDKSFKTDNGLKQHFKIATAHVTYKDLHLTCTHCDKRFAIKRDLERHMNRMHLNVRPYNCDQCDKAYVSRSSLKSHKSDVHLGFKRPFKYPCSMCDKVFNRQYILKTHIRTHTGERPYQCTKCPATFSQSGILNTHMRLIHLKQTRDGRPKTTPK